MKILGNSYVLGFLMTVLEMLINAVLLASGSVRISGIVLAMVAGMQYTQVHREKMSKGERLKALSIYFLITGVIGVLALLGSNNFGIGLAILAGTFVIFGTLMYFCIGFGSNLAMKMLAKQDAQKASNI